MAEKDWNVGDRPKITIYLYDEITGAPADPAALTVKIKRPDGVITTWVFGVDAEVVRDGVGAYHFRFDLTQATTWYYRVEATGALQVAGEGVIQVNKSNF